MAKLTSHDYIPGVEADFDEWQKNYVKVLTMPWPPADDGAPPPPAAAAVPVMPLYKYLGIPDERYRDLTDEQKLWNKDYARGGKEQDRRSSDAIEKQATKKDYVKLIRSITKEYILYNRKSTNQIKRALKLTVPDTEPSPIHGTDPPVVQLKNAGGAEIDFHLRRDKDQTRPSVLKGYEIEVRYKVVKQGDPPPADENDGTQTEISHKAHFKISTGLKNLGKIFYCYVRWRSKTNPAFNSPWTNLMQITIA